MSSATGRQAVSGKNSILCDRSLIIGHAITQYSLGFVYYGSNKSDLNLHAKLLIYLKFESLVFWARILYFQASLWVKLQLDTPCFICNSLFAKKKANDFIHG